MFEGKQKYFKESKKIVGTKTYEGKQKCQSDNKKI